MGLRRSERKKRLREALNPLRINFILNFCWLYQVYPILHCSDGTCGKSGTESSPLSSPLPSSGRFYGCVAGRCDFCVSVSVLSHPLQDDGIPAQGGHASIHSPCTCSASEWPCKFSSHRWFGGFFSFCLKFLKESEKYCLLRRVRVALGKSSTKFAKNKKRVPFWGPVFVLNFIVEFF